MRLLAPGLLGALGACSGAADGASGDPASMIECALGGAAGFERQCGVERRIEDGRLMLVLRHPDGGFRRFEVLADGNGVATADGAEPARISLLDNGIEVSVGADKYRLPATIGGHGGD
ncbi:hypothetical protein FHS61_002217 [Altererythrobacter atlanticus]|uniref:Uncharacterized protein n=1 Tax=Croceibacterium atlanticum TaxID=1267766 RepID=A0A0F7KRA2_9SPHN|nr:hypothetical protein [Croceibacterium atlanticum]AKH41727.1 hypothetical protein WYH_00671 [Croceibacterium atlanticum]MBB5733191.1 hypothetical protein [Croceibacterium atlanticum]